MTRRWYLDSIAKGTITDVDLEDARAASPYRHKPKNLDQLKAAVNQPIVSTDPLPTIAELAAASTRVDWPGIIADRLGVWAASHFDAGQALWIALQGKDAWAAYRMHAMHDITPEILGLSRFAAFVAEAPKSPLEAIARSADRLEIGTAALESYSHQLLLSLGGWGQYARYQLWCAELSNGTNSTLTELLAIRLLWEEALYCRYKSEIAKDWEKTRNMHALAAAPDETKVVDEILQEAAERAAQRVLAEQLAGPAIEGDEKPPLLQAAFCIDVRSEVFRRSLERIDPAIRTLGFAGFFGVFAKHKRFASDVEELRLPVLLNPTVHSCATGPESAMADLSARLKARAQRAWGRFKLAAVSSFAFVEAMGPVYAMKLLRDSFKLHPTLAPNDPKPYFQPPLDRSARIKAAETILRAMSLTSGFARIVLLVGHGASVVNNPHASGLHCGACGGYSGDVNARLLACLLNDREVRAGLAAREIHIPNDTLFIAAFHDTTADQVLLYEQDAETDSHAADLAKVRGWLAAAGKLARTERALKLPRATNGNNLPSRSRDWSETRPEWGLAGCKAFIAAPRTRTVGRNLAGRAFLHDYDWTLDSQSGFAVLELILTAPVVVASWISLQYYGSTVAPEVFGAGNKLLHNVVGGIGVVEGNGGTMRAGLPWQSVHDGDRYIHEPLRLAVCIEAPREAIADVLARHDEVRALFENRWLHLIALDERGRMAWRYVGHLRWLPFMDPVTDNQLAEALS